MKIKKEIEFEILHSNKHRIYLLCGIVCVVVLMVTLIITTSIAKYRTTESIPLIQGTINFSPSDLSLMAVYLNKNGDTISSDKVPHIGYTLNTEQSICEVNDVEDLETEIVYENGYLYVNKLSHKGTKCTAYFDLIPDSENPVINSISTTSLNDSSVTIKVNATDNIGIYYYYYKIDNEEEIRVEENSYTFEELEKNSVHTITVRVEDAAGNVASDSKEVIVGVNAGRYILASANPPTGQTTDWTGQTTYYYTGKPNNWVQFAGFWWRIIRINGDGSIRMIYQGTSANTTGTGTQIGTSAFNSSYNNKTYVGLVYDGSTQHGYGTNSTIMINLNNWYNSNLVSYEEKYIDTGTGFCSDRNIANGYSFNSNGTINYAPYDRRNNGILQCHTEDILSQDNGKIPNPIGLVTSDEYILAKDENSYLNVEIIYWTMSPAWFEYNTAGVFDIDSYGALNYGEVVQNTEPSVRPVINIRSDVVLSGSGTSTDPFKVVGA